jgi:glucan phosphoethanolaminetransferase (alkaline phosphatase superfamily)
MRPGAIILFEILYLLALLLGVAQDVIGWRELTEAAPTHYTLLIQTFALAITIFLILGVSRRRSKIAKWLLVLMFVGGLGGMYFSLKSGMFFGSKIIAAVQIILQLGALAMLFTPASRSWLGGKAAGRKWQ